MVASGDDTATNRLNLYLIKDTYKTFDSVTNKINDDSIKKVEIKNVGFFYYTKSTQTYPDWIQDFFLGDTAIKPDDFISSGTKAVLVIKINHKSKERFFAIPFGSGRFLLRENSWEERFGLITALNMLEAKGLRGLDKRTFSANPKLSREQISKIGIASDFDIDFDKDLIHSITGRSKTSYNFFGNTITGKSALSISAKVDKNNIKEVLNNCLDVYNKLDYKTDFDWIDQIKEEKDETILASLNSELISKINSSDDDVWLAVPDIVDWTDFEGFKYSARKGDQLHEELSLSDLLIEFEKTPDLDDFHNNQICFWSKSEQKPIARWSFYACLNVEMDFGGKSYLLTNKKWYAVNKDFVDEINKEISTVKASKLVLQKYNHANENEYNKDICKSLNGFFLDADEVIYGGGKSSIEVCDVFTLDRDLIHVKKYENGASLSHLFNQGFVSSQLIVSDSVFRKKVRDKLTDAKFKTLIPSKRPDASTFNIVFAVVKKKPKDGKFKLPLFSKITFRRCKRSLEAYGYNVYLNWVENIKP